ncbi:MAG: hypothetical protein IT580_20905 [Verrucomicrobiales bacterium]|nr:hypothetical protein [Verrucomicrobiales bacterium]
MSTSRITFWIGMLLALGASLGISRSTPAATTTSDLAPGAEPCPNVASPEGYGVFSVTRGVTYTQAVGADPVEAVAPSAGVSFTLTPPAGYEVSSGRVAGPGGFALALQDGDLGLSGSTNAASGAVLDGVAPAGSWLAQYLLGATNGTSFVAFFPFAVGSAVPPVPRVRNLEAAQAVNPSASFRLEWDAWTLATNQDRLSLVIVGPGGLPVLEVDSACANELTSQAASFDIPAETLAANGTYTGYLTFGARTLSATEAGTKVVKQGFQTRTVRFPLLTQSSVAQEVGTISDVRLSDGRVFMTVTGTPRTNYWVQSSLDGTNWTNVLNVYLPIAGRTTVSVVAPADGLPRQYRAILEASVEVPLEPASLVLTRPAPTQLRLTLIGFAGSTYNIEWSTNWVTWESLFFQGITLPRRPPGGIAGPPGTLPGQATFNLPFVRTPGMRVYRAVTLR